MASPSWSYRGEVAPPPLDNGPGADRIAFLRNAIVNNDFLTFADTVAHPPPTPQVLAPAMVTAISLGRTKFLQRMLQEPVSYTQRVVEFFLWTAVMNDWAGAAEELRQAFYEESAPSREFLRELDGELALLGNAHGRKWLRSAFRF